MASLAVPLCKPCCAAMMRGAPEMPEPPEMQMSQDSAALAAAAIEGVKQALREVFA